MTSRFLYIALLLTIYSAQAQFIALPGVTASTDRGAKIAISSTANVILGNDNFDFSKANVSLVLVGTGTIGHTHTSAVPVVVDSLRMDGGAYTMTGEWGVRERLNLKNGKLTVNNPNGKLFYAGDVTGVSANDNSYVIGPMFTVGASTSRFYPIGTVTQFNPAELSGITDATVFLRMESIGATPPKTLAELEAAFPDIEDMVSDKYWTLNAYHVTTFTGATISLSLNNQSVINIAKDKPVVIELDSLSNLNDLQGALSSNAVYGQFVQSSKNTAVKGGRYMIAASNEVTIKIHKVITPNGDGFNDVLVIEGIDLYPTNKVTLLDRWGGAYLSIEGFTSSLTGIDYTKLVNGNYICIVEYTDGQGKTHKPKPQMITVLK